MAVIVGDRRPRATDRKCWTMLVARTIAAVSSVALCVMTPAPASAAEPAPEITCHVDWVHDGDTLRCHGFIRSTRLYAIDAPELGKCRGRKGRQCVAGDGEAAKRYLVQLIAGRDLQCEQRELDRYRRPVMRCLAGGVDLSCAMVRGGFAVERYGRLDC